MIEIIVIVTIVSCWVRPQIDLPRQLFQRNQHQVFGEELRKEDQKSLHPCLCSTLRQSQQQ